MSVIVIYNSKSGFTKKYADWIAEELNCNTMSFKDMSKNVLNQHSVVIFGSRLYAGRVEHLNKVKERFINTSTQKLIVFATGATPVSAENVIDKVWHDNFSEAEINYIPHFYFQSGLAYEKMSFIDKMLMKIFAKIMSKKKDKTEEENGFEQAIQTSFDISSREYILPLVDFIKTQLA